MRAAASPGNALPRIDFKAELERCPGCDQETSVYKSRTRTVVTLAQGQFEARELLACCDEDAGCPAVGSEELRRLVPPRQRYGYDLIVGLDGWRRWVLGAARIPTEHQDHLQPIVPIVIVER